jgi:phosphatidylserine decarboxylase
VVADGCLVQAKGRLYTAAELLDDERAAGRFAAGRFLTLYLSPRHYHRIHAPLSGSVGRVRHVPGRLLPVNGPAVRSIDRVFPRNERLICHLSDTALGEVAVVAVGAFNVGRITAAFDPRLVTNRRGARAETRVYQPPVEVGRGDELMTFHLGSTVVLLFEPGVELEPHAAGTPILLGAPVAR